MTRKLNQDDINKMLRLDESILWENIKYTSKKKQGIKEFYLLTNQRWIQSANFPIGAEIFVPSLINLDKDAVKIELGLVQGIWISKRMRNKVMIGPYLNPYLIEYPYECSHILGLKLLNDEALITVEKFKEIMNLADELRIDDYISFYPRIE